jgi:hypothetical protein
MGLCVISPFDVDGCGAQKFIMENLKILNLHNHRLTTHLAGDAANAGFATARCNFRLGLP